MIRDGRARRQAWALTSGGESSVGESSVDAGAELSVHTGAGSSLGADVPEAGGAPSPVWVCDRHDGPIVAAAIHQGHELRAEVAALMALDEDTRLREEDPLTGLWTHVACTKLRVMRSRFEVDLNRPREIAVPLEPEQAWGLRVWKRPPPADLIERSRAEHDAFYRFFETLIAELIERHGRIVVLDIHSYNHRRSGPDGPPADPDGNPEINIGTGTLVRARWAGLIDGFIRDLRAFDFEGRHLDVRENVKFRGGYFPGWLHARFPDSVCTLALEFKKFFMDEWSAQADIKHLESIRLALQSTVPGVLRALGAH